MKNGETKPLLAWLFNEAPNKEEVVINDRWGKVRKNMVVISLLNMAQGLKIHQLFGKKIEVLENRLDIIDKKPMTITIVKSYWYTCFVILFLEEEIFY